LLKMLKPRKLREILCLLGHSLYSSKKRSCHLTPS
jgi:hypothetical protein